MIINTMHRFQLNYCCDQKSTIRTAAMSTKLSLETNQTSNASTAKYKV